MQETYESLYPNLAPLFTRDGALAVVDQLIFALKAEDLYRLTDFHWLVLAKFNRSSQHRIERGCDDDTRKAFGTGRASETTLARPALGWSARGAAPVLGGDCDRTLE